MGEEGFFARWSRKKAGVAEAPVEPPPSVVLPAPQSELEGPAEPAPPPPPPPTMDDVARLTPESDFSRFVAPDVDDGVKQAAMKKLFADPHFNVMDGLDTYIDDYGKPDPIPESMLRRMVQSSFLGLFETDHPEVSKDHEKTDEPKASPDGAAPAPVSKSPPDPEAVPPDEDPDLRLQQDDAAGPGGADPGSRA
jgi:hypothetical protein